MTANIRRHWHGTGLVALTLALSACGGGSGSGSSETPATTAETTTFSGNVELVNGTAEAQTRPWEERLLAFVLADTHADIGGLIDAPDGTSVRLIRIDSDGNQVEQLDTTTTSGGSFVFDVDLVDEVAGDLVIEAGNASDPVRAPAGGEDVIVNPVSSNIVNKVIARVQAGGSFSDFRAADLANLVGLLIDELDSAGITFSGTNAGAASTADTEAGDLDDDLVASIEGENALATGFVGDKNLAIVDVLLEAFGDNAGFAVVNQTLSPAITDDLRLDAGGRTLEDSRTERGWDFNGGLSSTGSQTSSSETAGADEIFDVTVGADGRLFALGGSIRGALSDDSELFALTETRTELDGNGAAFGLFAGASRWSPGDFTEAFNFVKFTGYVEAGADAVGYLDTLRGDADLDCSAGTCDVALDRFTGADLRKYYAQTVPGDASATGSTADGNFDGSTLDGVLELNGFSLDGTGRIGGSVDVFGKDYRTRGFVAPDAGMLVLQVSSQDVGVRAEEFFVGLPQGTGCTAGDLNGAYNVVWLTGGISGGSTLAVESETLRLEADGAGSLDIAESRYREAVITFDGTNTGLSRDLIADTDDTGIPYSVDADCKVEIADVAGDRVLGAVSPGGRAFVLATYTVESATETFQSLAIGLHRPAP